MSIEVTTGGPIEAIGPIVNLAEANFSNLVTQIADEIDDTTNEYNAQIQTEIFAAIRYCEKEVYYFNETRDETFVTVNGQEWYDGNDNENIPTLGRIVAMWSEDSQGQRSTILRRLPEEIETLADNGASRGEPYLYTYFGRRIRLYPIPDASEYTIRLQLSPYKLAPISDPNESNAWTTEAFDMIKARAKYGLYKNIIKDATLAAEALNDYNDHHQLLKAETSRRNGSGYIRATCF